MILLALIIILLSLIDFLILVPILLAIILKSVKYLHDRVTSDIPGNPHAFDDAVISLFRTLPEPSNFNLVWTGLLLQGTKYLRIRGKKPKSRVNSLTIYNSLRMNDQPISIDLEDIPTDKSDMFEVILAKEDYSNDNTSAKVINCQHLSRCMIAMRNYLVLPGIIVETPTIVDNQGGVIRSSERLIAGPASFKKTMESRINKQRKHLLLANLIAAGIITLQLETSYFHCWLSLILSGLIALSIRNLCFMLGRSTLRKMVSTITKKQNHKFFYPNAEESSSASQPSKLHKYWIMSFDLTDHKVSICLIVQCDQ